MTELSGPHQHAGHSDHLSGQHVVIEIVADHVHLIGIDTDPCGRCLEADRGRLSHRRHRPSRRFLQSEYIHSGIDAQSLIGFPRGTAVHCHHRHACAHPLVDPAQRPVVVLRAGPAEDDDIRFGAGSERIDDVHAGHVGADVAAIHHTTTRSGVVRTDMVGGQQCGGDYLLGPHVHSGRRQGGGDLEAGQ